MGDQSVAHKQAYIGAALAIAVAAAPSLARADVTFTASNSAGSNVWSGSSVASPTTILADSAGSSIITNLNVNPDPGFTVANSFVDNGVYNPTVASDVFNFLSVDPSTPLVDGQAYTVTATLGITETANPGLGQGAIMGDAPGNVNLMLNNVGGCAAGVDVGGTGLGSTAGSTTQGFSATSTFIASAGCDSSLIADFTFAGNGGGNTYSLSESLTIEPVPVPEPMGAALLGVGVLALVLGSRRQNIF
jgi:hypothetical protein